METLSETHKSRTDFVKRKKKSRATIIFSFFFQFELKIRSNHSTNIHNFALLIKKSFCNISRCQVACNVPKTLMTAKILKKSTERRNYRRAYAWHNNRTKKMLTSFRLAWFRFNFR